jgi:hypothetical protein
VVGRRVLLSLLLAAVLAGCGRSGNAGRSPAAAASAPPPVSAVTSRAGRAPAPPSPVVRRRRHAIAPRRSSQATVARVDASSDAALVKVEASSHAATVAPGAPSDAEIRREVAQAERAGIVLPTGNTASSFEASVAEQNISLEEALAVGASIPQAPWNPLGKPIADWIVPILVWAHDHGWGGIVTSGYRTYAQQAALNAAGAFSAAAGTSNHESTAYPGGAVDVSDPAWLIQVLATYPGPLKLVGGVLGPVDPEHFSATGF